MSRKYKAWLVTWEWVGNHAKRDDKIVAVFDPRMTPFHIQELVELLHINLVYGIGERVYYALHRRRTPTLRNVSGEQETRDDGRP